MVTLPKEPKPHIGTSPSVSVTTKTPAETKRIVKEMVYIIRKNRQIAEEYKEK